MPENSLKSFGKRLDKPVDIHARQPPAVLLWISTGFSTGLYRGYTRVINRLSDDNDESGKTKFFHILRFCFSFHSTTLR